MKTTVYAHQTNSLCSTFLKKITYLFWSIFVFVILFGSRANAQVTVSGSTGADGNYTTLGAAFTAINTNTNQSANNIAITITASTTETATASLTGQATNTWASLKIYPTVSGLSISGGSNTIADLITLDGADNVTIDGRVNQTGSKDLVITNSYNNIYQYLSTIKFIGDAQNNTVKYCTVKGLNNYYQSTASGVIFFSTGSSSGNTGNTIDNCDITGDAAGIPKTLIFSQGTAAMENTATISNNNLYNFRESGIWTSSNNKLWVISGNSFYQTDIVTYTVSSTMVINLNGDGDGHQLYNNYIGGDGPNATVTNRKWTVNSTGANPFVGIYIRVGKTTATKVYGNTIKNLDLTISASQAAPFQGIQIFAGNLRIGTDGANYIGDNSTTGSITVNANYAIVAASFGINHNNLGTGSTNILDISNNIIGSITLANSTVTGNSGHRFIGISTNHGTNTIYNNTIGSATTANSINLSNNNSSSLNSGNSQHFAGIYCTTSFLSTSVNSNTIANITNAWNVAGSGTITNYANWGIYFSTTNASATSLSISSNQIYNINSALGLPINTINTYGILFSCDNAAHVATIENNTIYGLTNTNATFTGQIVGISYAGAVNASTVTRNFIHSLSITGASSIGGAVYGISISRGSTTYANNIIRLGGNTKTTLYGFYETYGGVGDNNKLYFNTVYLDGNLVSGSTNKSYALYNASNSTTRDFRNNIFFNERTTTGGSNLHYAMYVTSGGTGTLTCNYNDYIASGTSGTLGYYGGNKASLPIVTSQDAQSLSTNPVFASSVGTNCTDYYISASLAGVSGTGITTDYIGNTRAATPQMGAWEVNVVLPVTFTSIKATKQNNPVVGHLPDIAVEWKVDNQINISAYEIEKSVDGLRFSKVATLQATGTNGARVIYNWLDINGVSGHNYYRIRSIGFGGYFKYSTIVNVNMGVTNYLFTVYPNPVTNRLMNIQFTEMDKGVYRLRLINTMGQPVFVTELTHTGGSVIHKVKLGYCAAGNYQLEIVNPDNTRIVKAVVIYN